MSHKVLPLALLVLQAIPAVAWAQDDDGGFLEEEDQGGKKKKKDKAKGEDAGAVREITRGFYAKTNVGAAAYLGGFSSVVNPGTFVGLSVGQDFVDNERQSMSWEVALQQGLHNGMDVVTQSSSGCQSIGGPVPCTEGDLRTYTLAANYEISFYPTRRIGVGARAGAGVLFSPHLIESSAWNEVLADLGTDPGKQGAPKPVVFGGPTFEYYTKLSHFSVGVDLDVFYGIGWDLGLNGSGTLKYTF